LPDYDCRQYITSVRTINFDLEKGSLKHHFHACLAKGFGGAHPRFQDIEKPNGNFLVWAPDSL
jgi:hypothetical protein